MGLYLEHLNQGNTEVEICLVAANKTDAVEDSDGDNCADIGANVHVDISAAVKETCGPSQNLRDDTGEQEMPTC